MNQDENPQCCDEMKRNADLIERVESGDWHGLKKTGWAMRFHLYDGAEYVMINFCPFCATNLIYQEQELKDRHCAECNKYTENGIGVATGKIFVGDKNFNFVYLCDVHIKTENGVLVNCRKVRIEYQTATSKKVFDNYETN